MNAQNDIRHTSSHVASDNVSALHSFSWTRHQSQPNTRWKDRSTPLHWASYWGELEVAYLLFESGPDVDTEDDNGRTAYRVSLKEGHDEIAHLAVGTCCREQDVVFCLFMNHDYTSNCETKWNLMRILILEILKR